MRAGTSARRALCILGAGVAIAGLAACDPLDPTTNLTVTTVFDGADVAPGDGVCEVTIDAGDCSLRAAVDEANANAHITQVTVPAGVYSLQDAPTADDTNAYGDLDLDPAAGHLVLLASSRSVVVDAAGAAGGIDVRGGTVVAMGISVMESDSAAAAFTTRAGASLSILYASPYANGGPGAAFEAGSSGQVLNSTLGTNGAGLVNDGDVQVRFATITANGGAGIAGSGTTTVSSSIVVNQQAGPDCASPVTSIGWNAFGEAGCGVGADDTLTTDLALSMELAHGVPVFVPGSASFDVRDAIPVGLAACNPGTNEAVDQDGQARPLGGACDKGAYESAAPAIDLVVDTPLDGHDADLTDGVCDDGAGGCTLRAAVEEANVQGGATATHFDPVTITIAPGITPMLTLDSEDPTSEWNSDPIIISGGVTIDGNGGTIDMGQKERGFEVRHQYLELRNVSIVNADFSIEGIVTNVPAGGSSGASITLDHALVGDDPLAFGYGWNAVLMSGGDFTMVDSSIGNVREHAFQGTGLGSVHIERSTVMGSEWGIAASAHDIVIRDSEIQGALLTGLSVDPTGHILIERSLIESSIQFGLTGPFTVRNSTYSGNRGPLIVRGPGTIELSTLADNSSWSGYNDDWNDLWVVEGPVTLRGNVLGAGVIDLSDPPTDYPACATVDTGTVVSGGYNVVADTSCGLTATGDVQGVDPLLAGSADNGGPTRTRLPQAGSPALDIIPVGVPGLCDGTLPTDQRGKPRPLGAACDAGAVEAQTGPIALVVDSASDAPDADPTDATCDDGSGACTLRAAFEEANVQGGASPTDFDPVLITIAPGVDPVLDPAVGSDAPLVLGGAVTIDGGGATIDLGGKTRNIEVQYKLLTLHDVTVTGAAAGPAVTNVTPGGIGAPIALDGADLGGAGGNGGDGVSMDGGALVVSDSTIRGSGGAAVSGNAFPAVIERSTLVDNHADLALSSLSLRIGESRFTGSDLGSTLDGTTYVTGSTFDDTGGITTTGSVTLYQSTVTGNDHGFTVTGNVFLYGSTIADNNRSGATGLNAYEIRLLGSGSTLLSTGSIISSSGYQACRPGTTGRVVSRGYSLGSDTSCRLIHATDRQGQAPLLGPLADNGGPTPTRMTLAGSPVVDVVPVGFYAVCDGRVESDTDQRGVARPQGTTCDIGSVER